MTDQHLSLLQSYFPHAFPTRENSIVSDLVFVSSGWESDVFSFNVEWGPAGTRKREDLILRFYPGTDAVEKSAAEFRSLTILLQAGYPVPRIDCLENENSPFGKPFLIMERIPGGPLWTPLFHASPPEQQKMLELFCNLFVRLHSLEWRPFVPNAAEFEPEGPHAIIDRQINRWQQFIERMPLPGFQAGWQWLVDHRHDVISRRASLVHWDFHPHNILLTEDQEAFVIDWTGLDLTDYRFDLAWTLLLILSYKGKDWRDRVLREYERQAGQPVDGLEYFDAIASFRRLFSVVGSLALGAEKMGMRPGAEEVMRGQAEPLRNVYTQFLAITGQAIPEVETFLRDSGV